MGGGSDEREIGDQAVWSLSTAKPGNGVEQLRDDNSDTYWQCVPLPAPPTPHARHAHDAPSCVCPGRTARSRT
tara:strand:- start:1474 stop:1692 length:219 start_codon:yes stop_codon:yes gene_type:complete|eukprot:scaffold69269_cov63-Phaeocystis_antarctica.AAC.1